VDPVDPDPDSDPDPQHWSEGNPMSLVCQNIDPPPTSPPGECVPAFIGGGGHTRRAERGVGGQYFGSRET
jgi:hypothetical protein